MTITLMTQEVYDELCSIQKNVPSLTHNFKGFDCFDRSKFTPEEAAADARINEILKEHIKNFKYFQNFTTFKDGSIALRFQYHWSISFTGVGYLKLSELFYGFENREGVTEIIREL